MPTYTKEIRTLSWALFPALLVIGSVWRTPSSSVVASYRMFNFNDLGSITESVTSLNTDLEQSYGVQRPYPKSPSICVQYGYMDLAEIRTM